MRRSPPKLRLISRYCPPKVDRTWPGDIIIRSRIYPIFYLLKGDYNSIFRAEQVMRREAGTCLCEVLTLALNAETSKWGFPKIRGTILESQ